MSAPDDMPAKVDRLKAELRAAAAERQRDMEQAMREACLRTGYPLEKDHYILDGDEVVEVDIPRWAAWFECNAQERIIARTVVVDGVDVSTVFLGLDHNFSGHGPPILFETMVFGGLLDQDMCRYTTIAKARAGHWAMVERVKRAEAGESL